MLDVNKVKDVAHIKFSLPVIFTKAQVVFLSFEITLWVFSFSFLCVHNAVTRPIVVCWCSGSKFLVPWLRIDLYLQNLEDCTFL